ncbi:molecular chaperone DnaJ [Streptoalloteichus tenebrarius]|uniref:Molecular chaperone DnaJ n=1 Tax=Streptoalloteichus tenebrarius (strain ATCC 17920 / DSM 40477 / JCM 4838 / CBS 697.72 / NBRC 16177 / NCIMB 11028 / NRRL B-12390 / A12253. 1 / ISP 5477) TaxID=1933 RepID=A0ABT1HWT8_STRSD|nr:molecular chaperone DnaJ [Streptoalloteichus tenebrarius]BFF03894.1 hypothetical protein GCM10020241_55690 [Streptoalloteichus tenebrarius]
MTGSEDAHRRDPYEVLGVPSTASQEEIAHAYRSLVRRHHPDVGARGRNDEPADRDSLAEVVAAYAVLRDPARRADHDRRHPPVPERTQRAERTRRTQGTRRTEGTEPTEPTEPPERAGTAGAAGRPRSQEPPLRAGPVRWHGPAPHREIREIREVHEVDDGPSPFVDLVDLIRRRWFPLP